MIIYMRKGTNRLMVEHVATTFRKRGFKVFIKNGNEEFALAVVGKGDTSTIGIAGVGRVVLEDSFSPAKHPEFVDAREYFRE